MKKSTSNLFRLVRAVSGQDLIEYALMAGFVAVAAGAIMPGVSEAIGQIFHKVRCQSQGMVIDQTPEGRASQRCLVAPPTGGGR